MSDEHVMRVGQQVMDSLDGVIDDDVANALANVVVENLMDNGNFGYVDDSLIYALTRIVLSGWVVAADSSQETYARGYPFSEDVIKRFDEKRYV